MKAPACYPTIWLVDALLLARRPAEAHRIFERMFGRATSLGRFAEEIEPTTSAHLGNVPQAFSSIGPINAGVSLAHTGRVGTIRAECKAGVVEAYRTQRVDEAAITDICYVAVDLLPSQ